jgi:putative N-acetylmannosamine-6-phosphate epimerase
MANEAVTIELLGNAGDPVRYTCATAIPKGTILKLSADRTVAAHAAAADVPIVGIAAMETDGTETSISVYTNGIFDITAAAGGVTALGAQCACSATAQMIQPADAADLLANADVGMCLEAHANNEVAAVRVLK